MTVALGMTDPDTVRIEHMTGPDIVANIVTEVTDKTCDILILYERRSTAEATGCGVGHTVPRRGTVIGVEDTSTLESPDGNSFKAE